MMNFAAVRNLNRIGVRNFRSFHKSIKRAADSPKEPCPGEKEKAPESPPKAEANAPQPPPCPPMPQCPPTMCPPFPDPNNPCNYTPPPCPDPDAPNLTRLKANQCRFQEDDGVPIFLKKGSVDTVLFQISVILNVLCVGLGFYRILKPANDKPEE